MNPLCTVHYVHGDQTLWTWWIDIDLGTSRVMVVSEQTHVTLHDAQCEVNEAIEELQLTLGAFTIDGRHYSIAMN